MILPSNCLVSSSVSVTVVVYVITGADVRIYTEVHLRQLGLIAVDLALIRQGRETHEASIEQEVSSRRASAAFSGSGRSSIRKVLDAESGLNDLLQAAVAPGEDGDLPEFLKEALDLDVGSEEPTSVESTSTADADSVRGDGEGDAADNRDDGLGNDGTLRGEGSPVPHDELVYSVPILIVHDEIDALLPKDFRDSPSPQTVKLTALGEVLVLRSEREMSMTSSKRLPVSDWL